MNMLLYKEVSNDWANWYIELYEIYPCSSKSELEKREGEVKQLIGKLNRGIERREKKQARIDNADKINSKLLDGTYHSKQKKISNTDMARYMKFFINNSPGFKKNHGIDNLSFIIKKNGLLTIELFELFSKKPDTSLRALEGRFVAICRIFLLHINLSNIHYIKSIAKYCKI